jgi:hypothetical protein
LHLPHGLKGNLANTNSSPHTLGLGLEEVGQVPTTTTYVRVSVFVCREKFPRWKKKGSSRLAFNKWAFAY